MTLRNWLTSSVVAGGLMLAAAPAQAISFDFSGSDSNGVGSATMDIGIVGNVLTATVANTSPTTLISGPGENAPGITGFGFNLTNDPLPSLTSWELTAYTSTGDLVTVGSSTQTLDWSLGTFQAGVTLDYLPQVDGIDGALFNPAAIGSSVLPGGSNSVYFTDAVLTMTFNSAPVLDATEGESPYVRMQNVGTRGEGSLKLYGTDGSDDGDDDIDLDGGGQDNPPDDDDLDGGGQDEPPIPEPMTALLGAMGLGLIALRRNRA